VHTKENQRYICNSWKEALSPNSSSEHHLKFKLERKANTKGEQEELMLKASVRPGSNLINKYDNFLLRDKVYETCCRKKIAIYSRHAIVNKTELPIKFAADSLDPITLPAHSSCLFDLGENKSLNFKTKGSGNLIE